MTTICSKCGSSLAADVLFCPQCGTPTSSYDSNSAASPYDPTAASFHSSAPQHKPATDYGSPPYGVLPQNPYEPPNPYEAPLRPPPPPPPKRRRVWLVLVVLVVLVGLYGGVKALVSQTSGTSQGTATAQPSVTATTTQTPQDIYNQATSGSPVLNDPLSGQDANDWTTFSSPQASCGFREGGYHISITQQNTFQPCFEHAISFSNFAAQVEMTMLSGDGGALLFRAGGADPYGYRFALNRDYSDLVYGDNSLYRSSDVKTNLNNTFLLTVIARGNTIYLYRDKQWLATVVDSSASSGIIGLDALKFSQNAEVVYKNLKVWTLP